MSATTLTPRLFDQDALLVLQYRPLGLATSFLPDELVYPGAVGIALGGFGLFLLLAVICALGIRYLGPMIACGRMSAKFRGDTTHCSFAQFVTGQVQTFTGRISGSAAMVQIALMPTALGCAMCFFAVLWRGIRG